MWARKYFYTWSGWVHSGGADALSCQAFFFTFTPFDSRVREHSGFTSEEKFVRGVVTSASRGSPKGTLLAIKHDATGPGLARLRSRNLRLSASGPASTLVYIYGRPSHAA